MAKAMSEIGKNDASLPFARFVDDDHAGGRFAIHQDIFTDPAVFDAEMVTLFENSWLFLAHESQLPRPHDFLTVTMGSQPVVLSRDADGRLHGLLNRCRHRGAKVCREAHGNAEQLRCFYHGWVYDSAGHLQAVADRRAYPDDFDLGRLNLVPIPRLESYRGLIFGALSPDVPPLSRHLGMARGYLDVLLDRTPGGITFAPGATIYGFAGNWKLQVENSMDYYHLPFIHRSFFEIQKAQGKPAKLSVSAMNRDYSISLGNGHSTVITRDEPEKGYDQHLFLFPNLVILERPAPQFRIIHPFAANETRVTGYAYFPADADAGMRREALRKYEIFYGPVGFGTPDDIEVFDACMEGFNCKAAPWNDLSRGIAVTLDQVDLDPAPPYQSIGRLTDENVFRDFYRFWAAAMDAPA